MNLYPTPSHETLVLRYTYTRHKCTLNLLTDEDELISRSDSQSFGYNNLIYIHISYLLCRLIFIINRLFYI